MRNGSHHPVAVVDDDEAVRDSLRFLLETAGYSVATYGSAAQFLELAMPGDFSCLVLDQHMPDITGLQLAARLHCQGARLPIVLITGSPSPDLARVAHDAGVTRVMEKPLDDEALLAFVAAAQD